VIVDRYNTQAHFTHIYRAVWDTKLTIIQLEIGYQICHKSVINQKHLYRQKQRRKDSSLTARYTLTTLV
jgi:hypothetical protein